MLIKHLILVSFHLGVYSIRSGELTIQLDSQLALPSDNWSAYRVLPLAVKTLANQPFPMINELIICAPVPDGQKIALPCVGQSHSLEESNERRNQETRTGQPGEEKLLDEKALEEVVGGDKVVAVDHASPNLAEAASKGTHYQNVAIGL